MGGGGVLSGLLSVLSSLRDILDSDFTENDVGGVILSSVDIGLVDGEEGLRRGIGTCSNEKRKGIIATQRRGGEGKDIRSDLSSWQHA